MKATCLIALLPASFVLFGEAADGLASTETVIAEAGESPAFVVALPARPDPAERHAAAEFCEHVRLMTGVELRTVEGKPAGDCPVVSLSSGEGADGEALRAILWEEGKGERGGCAPRASSLAEGWNWVDVGTLKLSTALKFVIKPPRPVPNRSLRAVYVDALEVAEEGAGG